MRIRVRSRRTRFVEEFRAILEVHRVEMGPAAAPNEAFGFEGVDDFLRETVREAAGVPPIGALGDGEVDGDPVGVGALAVGPGERRGVERPRLPGDRDR